MDTPQNLEPAIARELAQAVAGAAGDELPGDRADSPAGNVRALPNKPRELERFARENGMRLNEPARPELEPGESVTTEPDRWCPRCEQPRGGRKCRACKVLTVPNVPIGEAPEYEHPRLLRRREERFEREPEPERFDERFEDEPDDEQEYEDEPISAAMGAAPEPSRFGRHITPARRPERRGAPTMSQQQQRQQQHRRPRLRPVGDAYEDQETPSRRGRHGLGGGRHVRSAEQMLNEQWASGTVDKAVWSTFLASLLQGCRTEDDVERAAELADAAYIELMARQMTSG